jgi:predicted SprT family Zn-dependent metalloprotease
MKRRKMTKVKPILESKNPEIQARIKLIESMATDLMTIHNVHHYKFRFSGAKKALGRCSESTISLSIDHALKAEINQVKNTILHEIAHAIIGVQHGHKEVWQNKAIELGVTWRKGRYRK